MPHSKVSVDGAGSIEPERKLQTSGGESSLPESDSVRSELPLLLSLGDKIRALEQLSLPEQMIECLEKANALPPPADYPPGVDPHLKSHKDLLNSIFPNECPMKTMLLAFIKHHDLGYSSEEFDLDRDKQDIIAVFRTNASIAGSPNPGGIANEAYEYVSERRENYMVRKVLLHGTASIVAAVRRFEASGMPHEQARGLAHLFATHHPGYPIDMVRTWVMSDPVPAHLCPALLLDSKAGAEADEETKKIILGAQKREPFSFTDDEKARMRIVADLKASEGPDALRKQVAAWAGKEAGLSSDDAQKVSLFGFALDRITPARRMRDIDIDEAGIVQTDEKKNIKSKGETSKKYPLIVTNIKQLSGLMLENIFTETVTNVTKERDAAIASIQRNAPELHDLEAIVKIVSTAEIGSTKEIQDRALRLIQDHAGDLLQGFTGHLLRIEQDLQILRSALAAKGDLAFSDTEREACDYLIAVLQSIEMSTPAQSHIQRLTVLDDTRVLDLARLVLDTEDLSPEQKDALIHANRIGYGKPGRDNKLAVPRNHTDRQLGIKRLLLRNGGIDEEKRLQLAWSGTIDVDAAAYQRIEQNPNLALMDEGVEDDISNSDSLVVVMDAREGVKRLSDLLDPRLQEKLPRNSRRLKIINAVVAWLQTPEGKKVEMKVQRVSVGSKLLEQGKRNNHVRFLVGGTAKPVLYRDQAVGDRLEAVRLGKMGLPNIAGEMSLYTDGIPTATLRVEGDEQEGDELEVIEMDLKDFEKVIAEDPVAAEALRNIMQERFRRNTNRGEIVDSADLLREVEKLRKTADSPLLRGVIEANQDSVSSDSLSGDIPSVSREKPIFRRRLQLGDTLIAESANWQTGSSESLSVFLILSGEAGVYRRSPDGDPVFLGTLGSGQVVGEMALLSGTRKRSASIVAHTELTVVEIPESVFLAWRDKSPLFRQAVDGLVVERAEAQGTPLVSPFRSKKAVSVSGPITQESFSSEVLADQKLLQVRLDELNRNFSSDEYYKIVARTRSGVVYVANKDPNRGKLAYIGIANPREFVAQIIADEAVDRVSRFGLRQECLRRDPSITTDRAYSRRELTVGDKEKRKDTLEADDRWCPERLEFRRKVVEEWRERIRRGHEVMREKISSSLPDLAGKNVLVLLSGNTASGKSYTVKNLPASCKRLSGLGIDPTLAINPDDIKARIRAQELVDGRPVISSDQAHTEGSGITDALIEEALEQQRSMVLDKRFTNPTDVREVAEKAKKFGYHIVMINLDAEEETSMDRVFGNARKGMTGRDPNGTDPIPKRATVEHGYMESIAYRSQTLQMTDVLDEVYVLKSDIEGERGGALLASREPGQDLRINPDFEPYFQHAVRDLTGDAFVKRCMDNLQKSSRTAAHGIVTPTTEGKAEATLARGKQASRLANVNVRATMELLFRERKKQFSGPSELRAFIENIAVRVNKGVMAGLYRTGDDFGRSYTAVSELDAAMNTFCTEFFERLDDPAEDPVTLAAWVEYRVNICDHFFLDGCGKTANALSAWVLARRSKSSPALPEFRSREEYFSYAPKSSEPQARRNQFSHFLTYYRSLFAPERGIPETWSGKRREMAELVQAQQPNLRAEKIPQWQHAVNVSRNLEAALSFDAPMGEAERADLLCAAVGHDLYEDTDVTRPEIQGRFGRSVDVLIHRMTNQHGDAQVDLYVQNLSVGEETTKMIKLSDLLDNYRSIAHAPESERNHLVYKYVLPVMDPMYLRLCEQDFERYPNGAKFLLQQIAYFRNQLLASF